MELHTPRSLAETHGIDVYARGHRANSRFAKRMRNLRQRINVAVKTAANEIDRRVARRKPAATGGHPRQDSATHHGESGLFAHQDGALDLGRRFNRVGARDVFVVAKDGVPYHATFSQQEASQIFDGIVRAGTFRQASVVAISTIQEYRRVLLEAGQAA